MKTIILILCYQLHLLGYALQIISNVGRNVAPKVHSLSRPRLSTLHPCEQIHDRAAVFFSYPEISWPWVQWMLTSNHLSSLFHVSARMDPDGFRSDNDCRTTFSRFAFLPIRFSH